MSRKNRSHYFITCHFNTLDINIIVMHFNVGIYIYTHIISSGNKSEFWISYKIHFMFTAVHVGQSKYCPLCCKIKNYFLRFTISNFILQLTLYCCNNMSQSQPTCYI